MEKPKKLELSKETLIGLDEDDLAGVVGGWGGVDSILCSVVCSVVCDSVACQLGL